MSRLYASHPEGDIGGSIDLLCVSGDGKTVAIIDYKFGYVSVSPGRNAQLCLYALCAAHDPLTSPLFAKAENIKLVIIQPNGEGEDGSSYDMDLEDLDNFENKYLSAVDRSRAMLDNELEPTPNSGKWCNYCPAHATCPAKTGMALRATRMTDIQAEKLAEYLPMAEEVMKWAKEVQKMAHEQLEQGVPIDGYKLVNKRANRVWNDQAAVEDKVRKAKKIKIEDGFKLTLKSPKQLEDLCKKIRCRL